MIIIVDRKYNKKTFKLYVWNNPERCRVISVKEHDRKNHMKQCNKKLIIIGRKNIKHKFIVLCAAPPLTPKNIHICFMYMLGLINNPFKVRL